MRRLIYILSFLIYSELHTQSNPGMWTWLHGGSGTNKNYGAKGVPAATNLPPARYHPAYWQDNDGKFWMFSGSPAPADMWMYDPVTNMWTWMSGDSTVSSGNYGVLGMPSTNNFPKNRGYGSSCWVDSIGDLWLFAGNGVADLWKYHIPTNEWTWMGGNNPSLGNSPSKNYGVKGVPSTSNFPGERVECKSNWEFNNELLIYSGMGHPNDLWKYTIATDMWTWVAGSNTNITANYGMLGVPSASNIPPNGFSYTKWKYNRKLYLCSGAMGANVWSYDLNTGLFIWEHGPGASNTPPTVTPSLCASSSLIYPTARMENHTVQNTKCNKSFYTFGGFGGLNDLWIFNPDKVEWKFISGVANGGNASNIGTVGGATVSSNMPGSRGGTAIWTDKDGNLFVFGGFRQTPTYIAVNELWKYEPDPACIGYSVITKSLDKPIKSAICDANDSVVLTMDTALNSIAWNPMINVSVNHDTTRLVFRPSTQTSYMITAAGGSCTAYDTLNFTILISQHKFDTFPVSICDGTNYYGLTTAGVHDLKIKTKLGCDSNVRVNLSIRQRDSIVTKDTLCKGDTVLFQGVKRFTTGVYKTKFQNSVGCDSFEVLDLIVFGRDTQRFMRNICEGDTFKINSRIFTHTGYWFYKDRASVSGVQCDSGMYEVSITKHDPDTIFVRDTFCAGVSYKFKGDTFVNGGIYDYRYKSRFNCDSTIRLILTKLPSSSFPIQFDSIVFQNMCSINKKRVFIFPINTDGLNRYSINYGINYQYVPIFTDLTAGTYPLRIKRGCAFMDTMITIPYRQSDTSLFAQDICGGDNILYKGKIYKTAGVYIGDTFKNIYGCDSFVGMKLSVKRKDSFIKFDTICRGDSVLFEDLVLKKSGVYQRAYQNSEYCDSVLIQYLHVKRRDSFETHASICSGSTYAFQNLVHTKTGTYVYRYQNKEKCDSLYILHLIVNKRDTLNFFDTISSGDSLVFENTVHRMTGVYKFRFQNSHNCDSFRILDLYVRKRDSTYIQFSKCIGDSLIYLDSVWKQTGNYRYHLKNKAKTDSFIFISLRIDLMVYQTVLKNICKGQSYLGYTIAGTYLDTFKRARFCDSVREIILTVNDTSSHIMTISKCPLDSYHFAGKELTNFGWYKDTIVNVAGCDSFIYLHLIPSPAMRSQYTHTICAGQTYRGYSSTGTYAIPLKSKGDCDSIVDLTLTVLDSPSSITESKQDCKIVTHLNKAYFKSTTVHDTILNFLKCDSIYRNTIIWVADSPKMMAPTELIVCDSVRIGNRVYRSSMIMTDTIRTVAPLICDSLYKPTQFYIKHTVPMKIEISPLFDEYDKGEQVTLTTNPAKTILWNTQDTARQIIVTLNDDRNYYQVTGYNDPECISMDQIMVEASDPAILDIPNAFAPYGQYEKDRTFRPFYKGKIRILKFEIYNRWGEKVFTSLDPNIGWDGIFNGEMQQTGVYSYLLEYRANRRIFVRSGEVLLVR